jgi:succinyl-CoA synthetase beta subunit
LRLLEYEAKAIFSHYGIPVPRGRVASTPAGARRVAELLHKPVVVKAQVAVAGRGRAGGIKFAATPDEAEAAAASLIGRELKGFKVRRVLVEEQLKITKELFLGVIVDRVAKSYVMLASPAGGVEIEEIASKSPEKIIKLPIDPLLGLRPYKTREIAEMLGYRHEKLLSLADLALRLFQVASSYDVELAEVNPLVEVVEGTFCAADARMIIDDNALYRHPELKKRRSRAETDLTSREIKASEKGLSYVELDGNIGVIGNGAGLVMATLDLIRLKGGKPANFLDVGGGASAEKINAALDIVLSNPKVKVVFINILGGVTKCDEVATGIVRAFQGKPRRKPIIIRLTGTHEAEGTRILQEAGLQVLRTMEDAAQKAVEIAGQ